MHFRRANTDDISDIISLYYKSHLMAEEDELFSGYDKLASAIKSENALWILAEVDGAIQGLISARVEPDNRLCKITRMLVAPEVSDSENLLKETVSHFWRELEQEHVIDIVYTTTTTMSLAQQEITLGAGFKILGVFPNLLGEDDSQLNGLTAIFAKNVLEKKRLSDFLVHHRIAPFAAIAARECGFEPPASASEEDVKKTMEAYSGSFSHEIPDLEIVEAKNLVVRRFQQHISNRAQISNFYPFYKPNCLLVDPKGESEVYVRLQRGKQFAAIIGERMMTPLNPVGFYLEVQNLLREQHVSYIEIINDATDILGSECIMQAGFTPCAYFPAFKMQGLTRRDYAIFGKSFEHLCRPNLKAHRAYIDFYREYFRIEGRNYFPDF